MQVRDRIRRDPATIEADATIRAAAQLMDDDGVGAVLVTDAGRLVGVVTDRDLVVRGIARRVDPDARIDSMMTTDPVTISAGAELDDALELLRAHPVRRLPVTDGDAIVGMLSADDLLIDLTAGLTLLSGSITDQLASAAPQASPPAATA